MPTNESQLVAAIQKAIAREYPDAWRLNVVGNPYQSSGTPDLLVCVDGTLVGIEVKHQRPGESVEHALSRASALQRREIARIRHAGGVAGVVCSVEGALDLTRTAAQQRQQLQPTPLDPTS